MAETNNPAGRPKGAVNKLTEELRNLLATEPGEHPAILLKRIANTATDQNIVVQACKALLPYMAPKLKQVEHSGPDGGPIEINGAVFGVRRPEKPDWTHLDKETKDGTPD